MKLRQKREKIYFSQYSFAEGKLCEKEKEILPTHGPDRCQRQMLWGNGLPPPSPGRGQQIAQKENKDFQVQTPHSQGKESGKRPGLISFWAQIEVLAWYK